MLLFEFDAVKSHANKAKHGINFEEAQELWNDGGLVELDANDRGEERFAVLGKLAGKHWAAFYTQRGPAIRLISVRRARSKEVIYYESKQARQDF